MKVKADNGSLRETPAWSISFLLHNTVIHPIAGIFWFIGLGNIGNAIHEVFRPKEP
jgi:hypothetical protein